MTDLSEFLLARIAEDEDEARVALEVTGDDLTSYSEGQWWVKDGHARIYAGHWLRVIDGAAPAGDRNFANTAALSHIARHDPARVLAECEAKRLRLEDYEEAAENYRLAPAPFTEGRRYAALLAISRDAAVFADHPDYRQEWRP